jgi:hypothetical protein
MPYSVFLQINAQPQKSAIQIVQLDRTRVKVLGELKDVLSDYHLILKFFK